MHEPGPIEAFMSDDHARIDALLEAALLPDGGGLGQPALRQRGHGRELAAKPIGQRGVQRIARVGPVTLASASDNMPDAYRSVGPQLERTPGAPVLVIGGAAHSIGLYAVGLAVALGASRVDYIDSSPERLAIAESFGARAVERSLRDRWFGRREVHCRERFPITVDASGTSTGLHYAIDALAPGGFCTALAFYVRSTTPLPLWKMYLKGASFHVGIPSPHAHARRVVDLVAQGRFDPLKLRPLRGTWDEAESILLEPATKVILERPRLRVA